MAFRAFISVDLPPIPGIASLIQELRAGSQGLKTVAPDHVHVTLKFLGDTEDGLVPELVAAMREACHGVPPFTLRVRGIGAFPNLARMRVVWVGLDGAEPLARIARNLNTALVDFGFAPEDRPWAAHATVGRVKGGGGLDRARRILEAHRDDLFADVRVEEVRLKKSVLAPEGPVYTTVGSVALEG